MSRIEKKREFIKQLAKFLCENEGGKSISLQVEQKRGPNPVGVSWAGEWAKLRSATPLFGYLSVDEATKQLTEFLG